MRPRWVRHGIKVTNFFYYLSPRLRVNRCHLGKTILYDTVGNSSWSVDVRTHGIVTVIEKVLSDPWPPSAEIGREVPEPVAEDDCIVRIFFFQVGRADSATGML